MGWLISDAMMRGYAAHLKQREVRGSAHSLRVLEVESLGVDCSGGEPLLPSSGNHTRRVFLPNDRTMGFWNLSQYGMTCEPLTDDLGADVLMWSLADFHAKTSVVRERELASLALARDFGVRWLALFAKWNRDEYSWKTPRYSLLEVSTLSSEILPRWGSMLAGVLWERETLVRLTSETESGSLPTPVKYDVAGRGEGDYYRGLGWQAKYNWSTDPNAETVPHVTPSQKLENRKRKAAGAAPVISWPTPVANDAQKRGLIDVNHPRSGLKGAVGRERRAVGTFPTPIKNDASGGSDAAGRQGAASLKQVVARKPRRAPGDFPTQSSQNGLRGGSNSEHRPMMYGSPGDDGYGELNPDWCEWLMGWVIKWTSLEPLPMQAYDDWYELMTSGGPADVAWWWHDPSELGTVNLIPRTTTKDAPARVERISAIGNGQVSAAAAAAFLHLNNLKFPKE